MRRRSLPIAGAIATLIGVACASSRQPEGTPTGSAQEVKVVIDSRYLQECRFLKWFPFRDNVDTDDVVKAGGNVMFLRGDPANIGRFAAYRCGDEQYHKLPRIVVTQ
jgi:hypothetical protein